MKKINTVEIQGGARYAKVTDRLKEFRSENPRASITTTPIQQENGMIMFKAFILKDKSDECSADATGHALQTKAGTKDFEKLETVAVGRALALLGYGADGEIASSEEMEEFEQYQEDKKNEITKELLDSMDKIKTLESLQAFWVSITGEQRLIKDIQDRKDELKIKLTPAQDENIK